jgi:hypothetical protein
VREEKNVREGEGRERYNGVVATDGAGCGGEGIGCAEHG